MRRLQLSLLGVGLPLLVACLALSGCKRVDEPEDSDLWKDLQGSTKAGTTVAKTPIPMGKGVIKGKIVWKGAKPEIGKLNNEMLVAMNGKPDDKRVCLGKDCSPDEKDQQRYRIGANDTVGHVVIWLTPPDRNSFFEVSDDNLKALDLKNVTVEQPHCAFIPHVTRAFTHYADPKNPKKQKPTGQNVIVLNDAPISHNTKWADTGKIRGGNVLLPPTKSVTLPLVPETKPLRIQCSIHEWMDAWIWDFDHPYADVSKCDGLQPDDAKYGTFEIHNVPTNTKLKIVGWHEEGVVTPVGGEDIELSDKEPTLTKDFEISKK